MISILELPARWTVRPRNLRGEDLLMQELGLEPILARLVAQRGFDSPESAQNYLQPQLADLHDPRLLPDFDIASKILLAARESKDLIFIHGDYDVDGISSAALFDRFLGTIGCTVHTHVPHRIKEGYGIHMDAVDAAKAMGAKVFLTCDCGSSALDQIAAAKEAGMTVVVTDHHQLGEERPKADAFINPHRPDSAYPFKDLCGVGVVYKLCLGLARELEMPESQFHRAFLDLVVLGTVADVMPLVGENRILARHGLAALPVSRRKGIQALLKVSDIKLQEGRPMTAMDIGYRLGPRLNAAGRIDDAAKSLELLLEREEARALDLAVDLDTINKQRQEEQKRMVAEADTLIEELGLDQNYVIVVGKEGWHPGIVGIVAGKLVERYRRPAFVLTIDEAHGICKGSARSIPAFNLKDSIDHLAPMVRGGGHARAAGCSFPAGYLDEFRRELHTFAAGFLREEDFIPQVEVDLEVQPSEITMRTVEALDLMEPCGEMNPSPTFMASGLRVRDQKTMGATKDHIRLTLAGEKPGQARAVGFGMAKTVEAFDPDRLVDVVFRPTIDDFGNNLTLKWMLQGIRESEIATPVAVSARPDQAAMDLF